ncbi:MAG: peptide ABC transporter permease [Planctomycetota bacterium]|nr:MAG: peptide ABC transporter permease [Planctomycetota bacterium]
MMSYFIRRILLVPITFICITLMVYTVIRVTPGGPIERAQAEARNAQNAEGGGGGMLMDSGEGGLLSPKALKGLKEYYKLDKNILHGYLIWLGAWPDNHLNPDGSREWGFKGVLQLDLGRSYTFSDPVLATIVSKFRISIYFGLIGYIASWLVCIPLGVLKAIHHRTLFDTLSSVTVFLGYSVPGFVAALVLMLLFATDNYGMNFFPLGGFVSDNYDAMWAQGEIWWCIKDKIHHTFIPLVAYMMASFATMTILMKNSLLDNLGSDYVRTAFAKGLSEKRVIFIHALRNSLIPICVGVGHAIGLILAGSFLIEKTCDIPGMGLLGYESLIRRDYPVIMGILTIAVVIRLTGNIISDLVLALVDPRVRFS